MANLNRILKGAICGQSLSEGDIVKVVGARWEDYDHPEGGPGKWAIFLGWKGKKHIVRPLSASAAPLDKREVDDEVIPLNTAIAEQAIQFWRENRRR